MTAVPVERVDLEGLVHDLRNVFQAIGDGSELLAADPKWKKLAGSLRRSVDRGRRVAQSILESQRSAEAAAVVQGAVEFVTDYLESVKAPVLGFSQTVEKGFLLPGDPAAWDRVLVNLFLNAAEAGAGQIRIEAGLGELVVCDDGSGIPAELLPLLFEPHVSTKSIFSGLGLYIVRSVVEREGGSVSARNRSEGGAEFRIVMPPAA